NVVSAIRTLLRACGLHAPRPRATRPSHPIWAALIDALPNKQERGRLLGFARWCSDEGISPSEVIEQTLEDFIEFRRLYTITTGLKLLLSNIRWRWNCAIRRQLPGFTGRPLA